MFVQMRSPFGGRWLKIDAENGAIGVAGLVGDLNERKVSPKPSICRAGAFHDQRSGATT